MFDFPHVSMSAVALIIAIDILMAGDNAIIIGALASRVPESFRKKALIFGTLGAIVVRILATVVLSAIMMNPVVTVVGGALLLVIAMMMMIPDDSEDDIVAPVTKFWSAVFGIVAADIGMSIDNMLAIGGAAEGNWQLVVFGLCVSIPLILFMASWIAKIISRFPWLTYLGEFLLNVVAFRMLHHTFGTYTEAMDFNFNGIGLAEVFATLLTVIEVSILRIKQACSKESPNGST